MNDRAAPMPSAPAAEDLRALSWVQDEVRRSMEAAHKALQRHLREAEAVRGSDVDRVDPTVLRGARTHFHQAAGALELVGMHVPAQMLRASERVVQRMAERASLATPATVQAIEQASFALIDYLGRLTAGRTISSLALFPRYRSLLELAGEDRIHPADLWNFDWSWRVIAHESDLPPVPPDTQARDAMERLILRLMRTPDRSSLRRMSDLCAGLGADAKGRRATLWRLAAAFFEAQAGGLLRHDVYVKRAAPRLLAQARLGLRSGDVSDRLAHDLLFFCARAAVPAQERDAPRLSAVRRAYGLDRVVLPEYEASTLGRFDPTVVAQAHKRVAAAREAWSALAGGEAHRQHAVGESFALVQDSLERLYPSGAALGQALVHAATMATAPSGLPPTLAMEVATAVLYLEASLEVGELDDPKLGPRIEHLAARIDRVRLGAPPQPLEPWMEEIYRRVSDSQTIGSVVQELRGALSECEKHIDQFFRQPQKPDLLFPVPGQLSVMRGVVSVLGLEPAKQTVHRMREDVDALAHGTATDQQDTIFERLADNLGSLSFMIDILAVQPTLVKSLFRYEPDTGRLKALMSTSRREAAPSDDLPDTGPGDLGDRALRVAHDAARSEVSDEMLVRELRSLSQQALLAEERRLADTLTAAQAALERATDPETRRSLRAELAGRMQQLQPGGKSSTRAMPLVPAVAVAPLAAVATGTASAAVAAAVPSPFPVAPLERAEPLEPVLPTHAEPEAAPVAQVAPVSEAPVVEALGGLDLDLDLDLSAPAADAAAAPSQPTITAAALAPDAATADSTHTAATADSTHAAVAPTAEAAETTGLPAVLPIVAASPIDGPAASATERPAADAAPADAAARDAAGAPHSAVPDAAAGLPAAAASPAPAMPATALPALSAEDAEMLDVFLEEAAEVVQQAREALLQLQQPARDTGGDLSNLTAIRRGFHTLKGSSRMVGLTPFGEAAWACEQLYNARLAHSPSLDAPLGTFTGQALDYLEAWTQAIQARRDDGHRPEPVIASADALRRDARSIDLLPAQAPQADGASAAEAADVVDAAVLEVAQVAIPQPDPIQPVSAVEPASAPAEPVADQPIAQALADVPEEAAQELDPLAAAAATATDALEAMPQDMPGAHLHANAAVMSDGPLALPDAAPGAADDVPSHADGFPTDVVEAVPGILPPSEFDIPLEALEALEALDREPAETASLAVGEALEVTDFDAAGWPDAAPSADTAPAPGAEPVADEPLEPATGASTPAFDWQSLDLPDLELPAVAAAVAAGAVPALGPAAVAGLPSPDGDRARPGIEPAPEDTADAAEALHLDSEPVFSPIVEPMVEPLHAPESQLQAWPPFGEPPEGSPAAAARLPWTDTGAGVDESVIPSALEEPVKVIGPLRIEIGMFNIYLNEADELSRRLSTTLGEWAVAQDGTPGESAVVTAHSLAGSSATVGFASLSALARALEHALMRSNDAGLVSPGEPELYLEAAEEIRRVLHQFAAGFLVAPSAALVERLERHQPQPAPVLPEGAGALAAERRAAAAVARHVDEVTDVDAEDNVDPELFPIFVDEALELLPELQGRMRAWLQQPEDRGAAAACMRSLHTFKGGARLAGAMRIGELTHRLETAVEHLLAGTATQAADIEPLVWRVDAIEAEFHQLREAFESAQVVADTVSAPLAVAPAPDNTPAASLAVAAPVEASDAAAGGPAIDWARLAAQDRRVRPDEPNATHAPHAGAVRVRATLLDRLVNHAGEVSIARTRLESDLGQIKTHLVDLTENLDRLRRQLRDVEVQAESQISSRMEAARAAAVEFDPLEMDRYTRVQELTRMMAESVNDVATVQRGLQRTLQSAEDQVAQQGRLTRSLQDDLLRTRMVEFESLSDRLYRVVRQAAKETGKQVRLDIVGGTIEIDRSVLERMTAPFEHLLRNAITHGIERPEVRTAAGKPAVGAIEIRLQPDGNEVAVEFVDDGAGLNLDRIRDRAQASGMLVPGETPSDEKLAAFIFAPGFTTAETVTELAGRGVGMDVVRSEIRAIGGRVQVQTTTGAGARFRLVLPLTTAVTQVVMLRCGERKVAVPANLVEIVRREPAADVENAYRQGTWTHGGETIPFHALGGLLGGDAAAAVAGRHAPVVIVRSASQRVALHVDEVLGNQEVVVKNLGPQLSRLPGLTGMTLLPSGAVAAIYNPVALASWYGEATRQRVLELMASRQSAQQTAEPVPVVPLAALVLVVDDSLTVRRVTQRLLQREGYRVVTAKDGLDALERIAEERPKVVLSDIEMPRMDGFDFVRNLRADPALAELPVIMITSRIAQKHRDYARELGVQHYLGKPYGEDELLGIVARLAQHEAVPAEV